MDLFQAGFLSAAGLVAGIVNGVAGGGSLVSFPALLAAGYPALGANVTSTVGIWPGYLGGTAGFRREVNEQTGRIRQISVTTLAGAVVGAVLLLTTPSGWFRQLAPFFILGACLLFACQPILARRLRGRGAGAGTRPGLLRAGTFFSAVYGSYFGAGLGVLLLGVLGLALPDRLIRLNGLRSVVSLGINSVAVVVFAIAAPVVWTAVALMAVTSLVGGFLGANFARWLPAPVLKALVIALGVATAVRLFVG